MLGKLTRRFFPLLLAASAACSSNSRGCAGIEQEAQAWRGVGLGQANVQQVAAVISPYSVVSGLLQNYVYCAKYVIPSNVTEVEVGLTNVDLKNSVLPGAYTMLGLAVGTSNASGNGWLTAPAQTWSNVAVPGDGSIVWNGPVTVTGPLLVAWQFSAGANVGFESGDGAAQIYGFVNSAGTTNVTALASMAAVNGTTTLIGGNILLRYRNPYTKLMTISDSIHRGIQYQGVPSTEVTLMGAAGTENWTVAVNGVASTTALTWSNANYIGWSLYPVAKQNVFVALGTNDISLGASSAQIISRLTSVVQNARDKGAWTVGCSTITPFNAFSAGQNTIRDTVNAEILLGTAGAIKCNWTVDASTIIDPTHTNAVPGIYGGPLHLNSTGLALITAAIPRVFMSN